MTTKFAAFLLLAYCLFSFPSCQISPADQGQYPEKNGKVIYAGELTADVITHMLEEPEDLHPTNSSYSQKDEILGYVYERLLEIDLESGKLIPVLAKDLPTPSEDKLSYQFDLRDEARWADGSEILAEDILFNLKLLMMKEVDNADLKTYAEFLGGVKLDPNNPKRFTLVMNEPFLLNAYFGNLAPMLNPRFYDSAEVLKGFSFDELKEGKTSPALQEWADNFNDKKYGRQLELLKGGSGPYEISEWLPDQQLVLSKREDYWGKGMAGSVFQAYPPSITFKMIKDPQAVVEALRQQALDVSIKITDNVFNQLQTDQLVQEHYKVQKQSRSTGVMLVINNKPDGVQQMPIFDDVRVRQALHYALPLNEILYKRLETDYIRANSPVAPGNPHYDKELAPFAYDTTQAKQLLSQAGWEDQDGDGIREKQVNGKDIQLTFVLDFPPQNQRILDMMDQFKREWEKLGFAVELAPGAMRAYVPKLTSGQFDVALLALTPPPTLPYDYKQFFHSENWPEGSNFFGYSNPKADSLIDLIRVTADNEARQKMAFQVNRMLAEEVPAMFLYHPTKKMVLHRRYSNGDFSEVPPYVSLNNLELVRE